MPLRFEKETPLLTTLFLIFAAIFDPLTPAHIKLEERKRLAFIYQMRRLINPNGDYLSSLQLHGYTLEQPEDINSRAYEIAKWCHEDLRRPMH